jgi:hypothetical protein
LPYIASMELRLPWWVDRPSPFARATVGPWEACAYLSSVADPRGFHWWVGRGRALALESGTIAWPTGAEEQVVWEVQAFTRRTHHPSPVMESREPTTDLRSAALACEAAMEAAGLLLPRRPALDVVGLVGDVRQLVQALRGRTGEDPVHLEARLVERLTGELA